MTGEIAVSGRTIAAFVLAGGLSACVQTAPTPAPASAAVACGTASPVVADPTGVTAAGDRLGPLMFLGFGTSAPRTPGPVGAPTKVLIHQVEPFDQPITLTGARCSDGQPLRFWYGPAHQGTPFVLGPQSTPVPEAVLAQTGELSVAGSQELQLMQIRLHRIHAIQHDRGLASARAERGP